MAFSLAASGDASLCSQGSSIRDNDAFCVTRLELQTRTVTGAYPPRTGGRYANPAAPSFFGHQRAEGMTLIEDSGERMYEAELHRLKGELLADAGRSEHRGSRALFLQHRRDRARAGFYYPARAVSSACGCSPMATMAPLG
jgi:hypothetical protein